MKKLFSFIPVALIGLFASAQNTTPRWGSGPPSNDNTGRVLTYNYVAYTEVVGADTLKLVPNAFENFVKPTAINDSITIVLKSNTNAFVGDAIKFQFLNKTSTKNNVKFRNSGSNSVGGFVFLSGDSTLALTSSKRAIVVFTFDGVQWVETSKAVQ